MTIIIAFFEIVIFKGYNKHISSLEILLTLASSQTPLKRDLPNFANNSCGLQARLQWKKSTDSLNPLSPGFSADGFITSAFAVPHSVGPEWKKVIFDRGIVATDFLSWGCKASVTVLTGQSCLIWTTSKINDYSLSMTLWPWLVNNNEGKGKKNPTYIFRFRPKHRVMRSEKGSEKNESKFLWYW